MFNTQYEHMVHIVISIRFQNGVSVLADVFQESNGSIEVLRPPNALIFHRDQYKALYLHIPSISPILIYE